MFFVSTFSAGRSSSSQSEKNFFVLESTVAVHAIFCTFSGIERTSERDSSYSSFFTSRSASSKTIAKICCVFSFFSRISSSRRAGVPITICGFSLRVSSCRLIGAPPMKSAVFMLLTAIAVCFICEASSKVGAQIMTSTGRSFGDVSALFSIILCKSGRRYANVFPVPVSD